VIPDDELAGLLFSTSLNFDLSAFEMFLPLAFGGCIVMVDNLLALHSAPHRDKVRLVNTGPALIQALLRSGSLPSGVTTVIVAGERLTRHLATTIFKAMPGVRLLNCYGPTETTVYSSCARVDPAGTSEPAIGRPIWNTSLHLLSSSRALLPLGAEGELFIGGAGVARSKPGAPTAQGTLCAGTRTGNCSSLAGSTNS
jgi:non-ribosomal peptide synthetase component F